MLKHLFLLGFVGFSFQLPSELFVEEPGATEEPFYFSLGENFEENTSGETLERIKEALNGVELRVTPIQEYPFCYTEVEDGRIVGHGPAFQILDLIAEKCNFSYLIVLSRNNNYHRRVNGSVIELLRSNEVDLVVGFIPPNRELRGFAKYSRVLNVAKYHIMMAKPKFANVKRGLWAPFSATTWLFTMVFTIGMVFCMNGFVHFVKKTNPKDNLSVMQVSWFIYGALMRQGKVPVRVKHGSLRILFATWWIFVTILTSFYTANLVAFISNYTFVKKLNGIEDFLAMNRKFLVREGGTMENIVRKEEKLEKFRDKVEFIDQQFINGLSEADLLLEAMKTSPVGTLLDYHAAQHLMYDYYKASMRRANQDEQCPFMISEKPVIWRSQAFAYNTDSVFYQNGVLLDILFDQEIQALVESGLVKKFISQDLPNTNVCGFVKQSYDIQLELSDLEKTFQVMFGGFLVSVMTFCIEVLISRTCKAKKRANRQSITSEAFSVATFDSRRINF